MNLETLILWVVLPPLLGSMIAGVFAKRIGPVGAQTATIAGVGIAFLVSLLIAKQILWDGVPSLNADLYTWGVSGSFHFSVGFLIDRLTTLMLLVVTSISLIVHIYSVGYMAGDPGYQRFFSYIAFFTFAMLMLITANNFLQLYFGWEGVGLASYLLIGFWFKRESANQGSLKAFLINRVGDFGFLLGIAAILDFFGSVDYATVFTIAPSMINQTFNVIPHYANWYAIPTICILLFIGAMGKSAQVPLHVWLPESMEGPTPISALIHAATMVTAGIYMVARMSPLYEYSPAALSFVLIIGATSALFTGLLAIVQNDIKRVVAYSTLSQLGYMVAALGVSAYAAGIFHLVTHAFFKALLFLAAGSVILALHHEQDMRHMGGLRKYLPITYITFLIGSLALCAIPPFSGFFSKDAIIAAVGESNLFGHRYAYLCVLIGTFVTALYTFRAFFMVFHTQERFNLREHGKPHEGPWVIWLPLIILAIPSAILGWWLVEPMIFNEPNLLGESIFVLPKYDVLAKVAAEHEDSFKMIWHSLFALQFWFALGGIAVAWVCYIYRPELPAIFANKYNRIYEILIRKYGFDEFNQKVFVKGGTRLAKFLYQVTDLKLIDGLFVNGSGHTVERFSRLARRLQSGFIYQYALIMVVGLLALLAWSLLG